VPEFEIKQIRAAMTVVNGRIVHDTGIAKK
jgi:hypothetical protein